MAYEKTKAAEYSKRWRENHPGYDKEKSKKYYYAHKEELSIKAKEYRLKNRDAIASHQKKYQADHKEEKREYDRLTHKDRRLKRLYGITLLERTRMFESQGGKCEICGVHETELKKSLCVDHDHKTKRVRGLICDGCNRALGIIKDDRALVQNIMVYLIKATL